MQKQEQYLAELRTKEEHNILLQEAKTTAEERVTKLEQDLVKERESIQKMMADFDAKKEEHVREVRKNTSQ
jgi:hypothetical protein